MEIDITCDGTEYIDFKKLIPFQGDLKTITDENLKKLKNSIIKYGFTVPAFIWRDGGALYILDAHQRMKALDSLFHDGYEIPDIPIIHIEADNEKEAKEKLLQVSSQYGEFSEQGFADFLLSADLNISELDIRLTNEEFSISDIGERQDSEEYTNKITAPIYEITGEKPGTLELLDTSKAELLIEEINNTEINDTELKEFLIQSARRHNVFTYDKIAEYYAHSSPEIQNLMEKSALVIIDFDKAIENGFVKLAEGLADNYLMEVGESEEY